MSRFLSQSPNSIPKSRTLIRPLFTNLIRNHSTRPTKFNLIEVDLGSDESSSRSEHEVLGFQRLHDAIQSILVRRAAPDWIVFVPGASYWIPPMAKNPKEKIEVDFELENVRGWPSFSYFVEGVLPNWVTNCPDMVNHSPEKVKLTFEEEEDGLEKL